MRLPRLLSKRRVNLVLGIILFLAGLLFLINPQTNIIGAVIGVSILNSSRTSILGIFLILVSCILFLAEYHSDLEKKVRLTSVIKEDKTIRRLAEESAG